MALHAFVDESRRNAYLLCAVLVEDRQVPNVRKTMRQLLMASQTRLHFKNESSTRKKAILSRICEAPVAARIYVTRRQPPREGRAEILRTLMPQLVDLSVERIVLEAQVGQDDLDRQVIFEVLGKTGNVHAMKYSHITPRSEPMLWVPDAIAWAYGKRGEWRQRVSKLVEHVGKVP